MIPDRMQSKIATVRTCTLCTHARQSMLKVIMSLVTPHSDVTHRNLGLPARPATNMDDRATPTCTHMRQHRVRDIEQAKYIHFELAPQ